MFKHGFLPNAGRRGLIATGVAGVLMMILAMVAPVSVANAAPQSENIPLDSIGAAPQSGTLPNQVGWSVDVGNWQPPQGYAFSVLLANTQNWTFDRPVTVAFGIAGLDLPGECVAVPTGTSLVTRHTDHNWDPVAGRICQTGAAQPGDTSDFSVGPVTSLSLALEGTGGSAGRGPTYIQVTYDIPVATITGPSMGDTVETGSGAVADFFCADGTGTVTPAAEIVGVGPIADGTAIDDLDPGSYSLQLTCIDQYGARHSETVNFDVAAAPVVTTSTTSTTSTSSTSTTTPASTTEPPATTTTATAAAAGELPRTGDDGTSILGAIGILALAAGVVALVMGARVYQPRHLR